MPTVRGGVSWRKRSPVCVLAAALALALFFLPSSAHAFPWMIKHGYGGCATCHADPSGGELLTRYGRAQSDLLLRMRYGMDTVSPQASRRPDTSGSSIDSFDSFDSFDTKPSAGATAPTSATADQQAEPSKTAGFLWGAVTPPDWLLISGSWRHAEVVRATGVGAPTFNFFPMMMDVYGQAQVGIVRAEASVGAARVPVGFPYARAAQITTNQDGGWNMISRSHWVGVDLGQERYLLRAGRMNLPFGVRIPEHTSWVRLKTRTDRESSQQHGVALAFTGDSFRGEAMAIAGNYQINPDEFRERGYSLFAEWLPTPRAAIGLSSLVTHAGNDRLNPDGRPIWRQVHGALARLAPLDSFVLLAEADAMLQSRNSAGYVGFVQGDWELVQGLHFMLTGEVLDQGKPSGIPVTTAPGLGEPKFGGWLSADWFFFSHMEARVDAVLRQKDGLLVFGMFHFYL